MIRLCNQNNRDCMTVWSSITLPVVFIQLRAGGVYQVLGVLTQQKSPQSGEVTVALEDDTDEVRSHCGCFHLDL